jgi:hypothetical protein
MMDEPTHLKGTRLTEYMYGDYSNVDVAPRNSRAEVLSGPCSREISEHCCHGGKKKWDNKHR